MIAERPVLLLHEGWDEEESVPWRTQMAENEPDVNEWVRRVIEDHWREQTEQGAPAFPATYGNPLPGVELQPAPNINEWLDNPFADPQLDTDGDGVEDWKEVVAGTNPQDPTSYPTTDPYPNPGPEPDPGWEPLPDTDGDGIPDIYDPCPFDALNRCADAENRTEPATDTTLQEILEELREQGRRDEADRLLDVLDILPDIAQENTLQDVRDAIEQGAQEETLGEILDVLERIEQQGETEPEPDPDPEPAPLDFGEVDVELGAWQPGQLTQDVWRDVETALAVVVTNVQQAADGKLVFLSSGWVPALSLSGSGECPAITMPILGHQQDVSVCNSPVHTVMATTARTALLALMVLAFWLGMTRWVAVS